MSGLTAHAISARAAVSCRAVLRRKRTSVRVSAVPRHATCAAADLESLPIPAKLKQIIGMFQLVPDPMSRYKQLLFYATKLKEFPDDARVEENKVQGCVSQVWVLPRIEDGKVYFVADSDSQLTKGLAALLCEGLSGASPKEILAVEPDFVELLGLGQSLTPSRTNGFMNMLRLMQKKTLEAFMAAEAAKEAA